MLVKMGMMGFGLWLGIAGHTLKADEGDSMIQVPAGLYESFIPERKSKGAPLLAPLIPIPAFSIDRRPVTNAQFLKFIQSQSLWQRDRVNRLFADDGYLQNWQNSLVPGPKAPLESPVVYVSWFAARAYCKAQNKRLASTHEWEYVASPTFYGDSAKDREQFLLQILEWYGQPSANILPAVGAPTSHRLGVQNLHGLIWEWTSDFNSIIASEESRENASPDSGMFCGAGALGGNDPANYASYMRFSLRTSLKGGFSLANLGFRCARDLAP